MAGSAGNDIINSERLDDKFKDILQGMSGDDDLWAQDYSGARDFLYGNSGSNDLCVGDRGTASGGASDGTSDCERIYPSPEEVAASTF